MYNEVLSNTFPFPHGLILSFRSLIWPAGFCSLQWGFPCAMSFPCCLIFKSSQNFSHLCLFSSIYLKNSLKYSTYLQEFLNIPLQKKAQSQQLWDPWQRFKSIDHFLSECRPHSLIISPQEKRSTVRSRSRREPFMCVSVQEGVRSTHSLL